MFSKVLSVEDNIGFFSGFFHTNEIELTDIYEYMETKKIISVKQKMFRTLKKILFIVMHL